MAPESSPKHQGVSNATYWKVVGGGSIGLLSPPMRQATILMVLLAPGLAVTTIGSGQPVVPGDTDTTSSATTLPCDGAEGCGLAIGATWQLPAANGWKSTDTEP